MPAIRRNAYLLFLAVCLLLVYAFTLAPDITWANRGADGGDLITAAATHGVSHPPGYPTYLIFARLFQFLPIGTLAFRTNLLSAVCAVLAAVIVADLVRRSHYRKAWMGQAAGLIAGLGLGLSPLFWSQAVITEVYTLHALFVALIIRVLLQNTTHKAPHTWVNRLSGLLFGLALGNQTTVAFLLPPFLFTGLFSRKAKEQGNVGTKTVRVALFPASLASSLSWRVLIQRIGGLFIGILVYLIIPLRARSDSPVIWGDPVDWNGLRWLVSGQYYHWRVFALPISHLWPRIQDWAELLAAQFGIFGLLVIIYALLFYRSRTHSRQLRWITGWMVCTFGIFALGFNTHDAYVLLIPVMVILAVWLGLGSAMLLDGLLHWQPKVAWVSLVGVILLVLPIFLNAWRFFPTVDASQDVRAVTFGREVMGTAPQNAILFALDDEDTFTLWYYHFALGERPDVAVLQKRLLPEEWYRTNMRETYPDLIIPEQSGQTWYLTVMAANQDRPNCEITLGKPDILTCKLK
ncbi:MAG: DUF2723 domain-containing protein [Anaerolineales bacterium]|nr:DUF2723 domain-containing protein [Anaerolineales bacterium]